MYVMQPSSSVLLLHQQVSSVFHASLWRLDILISRVMECAHQ